ncbi:EAL domain-containing protein [Paraburkholderia tropica]|uniref:EAL domain, c-di-GMP-specific phosphodiesterase class I (Or its enzymatically inactive variant) n=1 Tax=Paraburkholderia tropica TaxID=92647 RepID=A0AAQ1JX48_9BURK|nr:EAL domain-containing protein [Paraburkholderia tropica]MBB3003059.1 EAL domain-containing protein (putative c-di-GMP-specific phosphodiesterase class I) [Paraburkholderia tropica]MBB6322088.1 EAL domain-containing protein (putative c-di-GMP-specific phosphodiesterase class I) [Paraburkholderia tropica]PXX12736.1 EAL domain-containing protein (putative c-di-GMP-specific phosphodiesterase class I) [Paraburkholderia tropica]PZW77573.1 EAL domain-containing protein (putative c-di-GMP-specific p
MQTLIEALRKSAVLVVNRFYEELARLPKSRRILEMLSAEELAHLKDRQIQNLLALADPGLSSKEHAAMAMRIGRIHAVVGLDKEELVRSRGILQELLYKLIGRDVGGQALSLYARRLTSDTAWQLKAYQAVEDSQQDVLQRITRIVWEAGSYTHFIDQLVSVLGGHDEVTACTIGRPDEAGIFHFEAGAGGSGEGGLVAVLTAHGHEISVRADHPDGQGAVGRAWRSGHAERVVNYQTDPLVERWRDVAAREGLRSSVAIPIAAPGHAPIAIVMLFSAYPGGFVGPDQVAFIELLQTLLSCVASRLQTHDGLHGGAVPVSVRQHWAALVRTGALEMHYQPLLTLANGQVSKVEALARLRDGERLLTPDEFLFALSSDDLLALFARGLGQALDDRARWLAAGHDLEISVNLPPAALNDLRYFDAAREALETHACPSRRLTLEVLENESISLSHGQRAILGKFRALGVLLAQDDLGSGHSGLARLRELPFDWIKIDREIAHIAGDAALDALRVVYQITRLGHSLGKLVLAEGVDSADLLKALALLGVDGAQGYEIARPMPADELLGWIGGAARVSVAPVGESVLTRLARFVVWEERAFILATLPEAARGLLDSDDAAARTALADALISFGDILPAGAERDALQRDMLHAVVKGGRHSEAWQAALARLMRAISAAPLAA